LQSRLIVGISGASGAIYGVRLLEILRDSPIETHLIVSRAAARTILEETRYSIEEVRKLASVSYPPSDIGAAVASGSFSTTGMVIAPCSIKSAAEIAYGHTTTLLTRAADVALKERRRLVLLVRESPLHLGHLRMLTQLAEIGAIVAPPVPAFYARPTSLDDLVDHTVGRVLDLFGVETDLVRRWTGTRNASTSENGE
jgi:4-hydroxy-3-polyprenylbenzoate decarboxylase